MDPMTEDQGPALPPADPRRAVVFIVALVVVAAGVTIFLSPWIPLWLTLPLSLVAAMAAARLDGRRRKTLKAKDVS